MRRERPEWGPCRGRTEPRRPSTLRRQPPQGAAGGVCSDNSGNFMLALFMPEHSKQGIAPDLCKLLSSQHDAIEYEFQVALEMKEKF